MQDEYIYEEDLMTDNNLAKVKQAAHLKTQQIIQKQRSKLNKKISIVLILLFIVFFERIFFSQIIIREVKIIINLQQFLGISNQSRINAFLNGIFTIFDNFSNFQYYFLVFSHIYAIIFFSGDFFTSLKIMYSHYIGIFLLTIFIIIYRGPAPYWISSDIANSDCDNTYQHPNDMIFSVLFIMAYFYKCYYRVLKQQIMVQVIKEVQVDEEEGDEKIKMLIANDKNIKLFKIFSLTLCILLFGIIFLLFANGNTFLISSFMGIIYFALYFIIVVNLDKQFDKLVKKLSVQQIAARKYTFRCLFFVIIAQAFALMVENTNIQIENQIDYITNYIKCLTFNQIVRDPNTTLDNLLGSQPSFKPCSILFAFLGAAFGSQLTFLKCPNYQGWQQVSLFSKIIRILLVNIAIIPSWFILGFSYHSIQIYISGFISSYLFCCIYMFAFYFFIYGIMPYYIIVKFKLADIQQLRDERVSYLKNLKDS